MIAAVGALRRASTLLLTALACTLAACGSSPPTRFFTLDAVAPRERVTAHPDEAPVKVTAVHVPGVLDRQSMVRAERSHELQISAQERWGGDFGEMARRVLTQDLQARLPAGIIVPAQSPAPENARGLIVDILEFEPDAAGNVTLDADWAVTEGSPARPVLRHSVHLERAGANSATAQADTMSQLLGALADDVAASLARSPSHQAAAQ